jgi:hypothetical protein
VGQGWDSSGTLETKQATAGVADHPIDACPECVAKICWFSHVSPVARYRRLAEFCRQNDMTKEAEEFEKKSNVTKNLDRS